MATAVASKPVPHPQKMKRPPPFLHTSANGTKPLQTSPSPSSAAKRLPGQKQPPPTPLTNGATINGAPRPNRQRKELQRPGDQYGRLQRLTTRSGAIEASGVDKRATRKFPEPYVASESHILKKFKGRPPSLIVHLHPTHFRFDQQDGSFGYHSEMRLFIEHLKKKTIPHDMLEEFRKSDVQFYDGWLIVRVVDHKSPASTGGTSFHSPSDDQNHFSIHNYNPYITPSSWVPYPAKEQPNSQKRQKSPVPKDENGEEPSNPGSDSTAANDKESNEPALKAGKQQPKVFHVALRPTPLSRHMDIVIDSVTPDPKAANRRHSQAFANARTPGSAVMPAPPTPLSAVPPTPLFERGPVAKKQKMKVEAKDLVDYEARIINSTAPPIFLDPVQSLEEAQAVLRYLRDPLHDEDPPSPKGRKRTVAELAADDALAKEQERFMLIMDERNPGGPNVASTATVDGQTAAALFQPRFEKFNALENIKAQHEENKRRELERKMHQDASRRQQQQEQQEEAEKRRAAEGLRQQQEEARRRQLAAAQNRQREQSASQPVTATAPGASQPQAMPQMNGIPPGMQNQMIGATQAQRSSPVVRTSTPLVNSSPLINQMPQPDHSASMGITSSNQGGAGSPARPGSAIQHTHPGVAMARGQSNQGQSRNGTPQISHGTPAMRNGTPVMRHETPTQRMSQASPHGSMVAHTPQLTQAPMMGNGQHMANGMPGSAQMNPAQAAHMQAARQQFMIQHQAMLAAQQGGNNGQFTAQQIAQIQAQAQHRAQQEQQAALQQQQHQQQLQMQQAGLQQQHQQQQQQHPGQQSAAQQAFLQNQSSQSQSSYQQQLRKLTETQMSQMGQLQQQQAMQQAQNNAGSPQIHQSTPQRQAVQMAHAQQQQQQHQAALQQQQQQANQQQQHQNNLSGGQQQQQRLPPQFQNHFQQRYNHFLTSNLRSLAQSYNGNVNQIPPQLVENAKLQATQAAKRDVNALLVRARQQQGGAQAMMQQQQQQGMQGFTPQQYQQMMAAQIQAQQQQQQQQQQQGQMMQGLPGAGVMPK